MRWEGPPTPPALPPNPLAEMLYAAAHNGNISFLRRQVQAGADVNAVSPLVRQQILSGASLSGQIATMRYLLEKGASPEPYLKGYDGPLSFAADEGNDEARPAPAIPAAALLCFHLQNNVCLTHAFLHGLPALQAIALLLKYGANPCVARNDQWTALMLASRGKAPSHLRCVDLLLGAGAAACINDADSDGRTAAILASMVGRDDILELLLRAGASLEARFVASDPERSLSALHLAAEGNHFAVVRRLLRSGMDINARVPENGHTALHLAALHARPATLEALLEAGAAVDAKTTHGSPFSIAGAGSTPLLLLCGNPGPDTPAVRGCVSSLLRRGADANATDRLGNTPAVLTLTMVREGVLCPRLGSLDLLLQGGVDPNAYLAPKHPQLALLHVAIMVGASGRDKDDAIAAATTLLLKHDANPNQLSLPDGAAPAATPLSYAVERGLVRTTQALLRGGAADIVPALCLLSYPARDGNLELCKLLIDAGCSVDATDASGMTALMIASKFNHYEVMKALIAAGADRSATDHDGHNAQALARLNGSAAASAALMRCACDGPCGRLREEVLAAGQKLRLCSGCRSVAYCSADCQRAAWKGHKANCKELQACEGQGAQGAS